LLFLGSRNIRVFDSNCWYLVAADMSPSVSSDVELHVARVNIFIAVLLIVWQVLMLLGAEKYVY